MNKICLEFDFSNICRGYNTVYLDRDNDDSQTIECMKKVLGWFEGFFLDLQKEFGYNLYRMSQDTPIELSQIVKKRFFFYSLEKEMLLQTFVMQKEPDVYRSINDWAYRADDSLVIQNDENGEGVYFYVNKESDICRWMLERMSGYTLDIFDFEQL